MRDHTTEGCVFGDLYGQHVPVASIKRAAGPQNHALRVRVARGDSLRIEVAPLAPIRERSAARSAPRERCTDGRGNPDEWAAAECHVLISCKPLRMPREMLAMNVEMNHSRGRIRRDHLSASRAGVAVTVASRRSDRAGYASATSPTPAEAQREAPRRHTYDRLSATKRRRMRFSAARVPQ